MQPRVAGGLLALLVFAHPVAYAHHSLYGQFNVSKTVTLTGRITKVEWINPHPYVHLETRAADGKVTTWALSTAPLALLRKVGLTREKLAGKPGETVIVVALPALNGRPLGWITRLTYADGHFYSLSE